MDRIKVSLIGQMPSITTVKAVGKPYKNAKADMTLAEKVIKVYRHESVSEHGVLSFEIDGISRLCLQELARHRMASLTVESTRFCLRNLLEDYVGMMRNSESRMSDEIELLHKYFVFPETDDPDVEGLCEDVILSSIEAMGDVYAKHKGEGRKEVNDLMKYMLPESFRTTLVWTVNIRSLNNFLKLRSAKGSHFEIRKLAKLVYEEAVKTPYKNLIFDINSEERTVQ